MENIGTRKVEREEFVSVEPALTTVILGLTKGGVNMEYFLSVREVNELISKLKDAKKCLE